VTSPFSVEIHQDSESVVRLAVVGEIDEDVTGTLATIIAAAAEQRGVKHVVVDLRGVSFLAAAGLRGLLRGRAATLGRGCTYRLINARGLVRWVLNVTGTAELFNLAGADSQSALAEHQE
jgi:anti-anti-sigma factor